MALLDECCAGRVWVDFSWPFIYINTGGGGGVIVAASTYHICPRTTGGRPDWRNNARAWSPEKAQPAKTSVLLSG